MSGIWFILVGALIAIVCIFIGIFIGYTLASPDEDEEEYDFDDDYEETEEEKQEEQKFIEDCLEDKNVQKILDTYHNEIVEIKKKDINHNVIRLIDNYDLMAVELESMLSDDTAYYRMDLENYKKFKK